MIVSTKGRYALKAMLDMAENANEGFVPMKDIAARQCVSKKYLEQIMPALVKNGLVEGVQGKGGGYRLTRKPSEYTVGEILRIAEGGFSPVSCRACTGQSCSNAGNCKTVDMWAHFIEITNQFFDSISLEMVLNHEIGTRENIYFSL